MAEALRQCSLARQSVGRGSRLKGTVEGGGCPHEQLRTRREKWRRREQYIALFYVIAMINIDFKKKLKKSTLFHIFGMIIISIFKVKIIR